jgi:hypothetical protein
MLNPQNPKRQRLDIMSTPINVKQSNQIIYTQPPQLPSRPFPKGTISQLPLVLLKVPNTFINTVFYA